MDKLGYISGDLVYIHGSLRIINNCDGYYATYYNEDEILQEIDVNIIEGIPLTKEILEKNEWKLHKHHKRDSYDDVSWSSYHKPEETNISLRFYPEEKAFFLFLYAQEISETPIRYVHQFQHLLFGLELNSKIDIHE